MKHILRSLLIGAVLAAATFAQTAATLSGTTTDKSGAGVPATKLTVVNQDTQLTREAVSGEDGTFNVPLLPPGRYNIRVEKTGFKPINQQNVTLEVNQVARLDFSLEVGNVTETIEIKDTPALLDSDTSSIGQVIENRQITELPLNGRNFVQLATLSPGVSGVGYNATGTIMSGSRPDDSRPGSELFANGNREGSNNFLLDGVD
ncbi:MAG: carboxypeptidase-like regulatory domain-containing protein, partial [Acidobacteria bacterium]|nr:carboxypeptidase-like regulatory domain-containing protein [Acidobacteriota bacterium]